MAIIYLLYADDLILMPEFKDDFQSSLSTLCYCQIGQLPRNRENINSVVVKLKASGLSVVIQAGTFELGNNSSM